MINFSKIKGCIPIRLLLKIWPPYNEEKKIDINISIGMIFKENPNTITIISTDKDDLTSPCISQESLDNKIFKFSEFELRMNKWMKGNGIGDFDYEYYEVTEEPVFKNIVDHKILDIQFIKIKKIEDPIGVKILFEKDFIISMPISDGNTIETNLFNKNNNLEYFRNLGEIEYKSII